MCIIILHLRVMLVYLIFVIEYVHTPCFWLHSSHNMALYISMAILCLTLRTTVTSARIPEEDVCHRARNLYVFSRVQKGTPRLTHTRCVLQRVFLVALSDVTTVLGMRQSIVQWGTSLNRMTIQNEEQGSYCFTI